MAILVEGRIFEMALMLTIMAITYIMIEGIRNKTRSANVRRLPALDAIDEAAGRATELGRPFMTDIGFAKTMVSVGFMDSIAGLSVLGYSAQKCAEKDATMVVGTAAPEAIPLVREIVREKYAIHGNLATFEANEFRYTASFGMGYPIQILGLLLEFTPAVFLTIGKMAGSTVIYSTQARKMGAMTIGGTATVGNLVYLVGCYDYILMGEEIYAAGAYVSDDPVQVGTLSASDITKVLLTALFLVGTVLLSFGNDIVKVLMGM